MHKKDKTISSDYAQKFLEVDITADDELLYIINITNVTDDQMLKFCCIRKTKLVIK